MTKRSTLSIPGIYTITNKVTGMVYIGQSINIRIRWMNHRRGLRDGTHRNIYLLNAWRKYGETAFEFAVHRDLSHVAPEELTSYLNVAEMEAITLFPETYNLMEVGHGGSTASQETREILSQQRVRMWSDPAFRKKRSNATKALYADPEWKAARDAAVRDGQSTPEARAQRSVLSKTMWADPQFRAQMGAKKLANWSDPIYRAQQSESRKAAWTDPEIRARRMAGLMKAASNPEIIAARKAGQQKSLDQMGESQRLKWQDPEYRERQSVSRSKGQRARYQDPVARAEHSQRMKEAWARRKAATKDAAD